MTQKQADYMAEKYAKLQKNVEEAGGDALTSLDLAMYTIGAEHAIEMMKIHPEFDEEE